jgi:type II secretion system protein N
MKIDWTVWRPRLLYALAFAVAFALGLRLTFPSEAVKERLILEAGARGWQLDAEEVSAAGVAGLGVRGLTLDDGSGLKIPVDEASATLRLLPLLGGKVGVAIDASLYDGRVHGTADLTGDRRIALDLEGVALERILHLRRASGLDLAGVASGRVDVTLPADPAQKPAGTATLRVADAGLNGGKLAAAGGLSLPKLAFGAIEGDLKLENGRATFEKLEARGGDAELEAPGLYVVVGNRLETSQLFGRAKLRLKDTLWRAPALAAARPLAEGMLAPSRDASGAYTLQVFGTVGRPQARPVPPGTPAAGAPPPSAFPRQAPGAQPPGPGGQPSAPAEVE